MVVGDTASAIACATHTPSTSSRQQQKRGEKGYSAASDCGLQLVVGLSWSSIRSTSSSSNVSAPARAHTTTLKIEATASSHQTLIEQGIDERVSCLAASHCITVRIGCQSEANPALPTSQHFFRAERGAEQHPLANASLTLTSSSPRLRFSSYYDTTATNFWNTRSARIKKD